jgi:hypothetical protein
MNTPVDIVKQFKEKVCNSIELHQEGNNRYLVFTPFEFGDGDSFVIILKKEGDDWLLTDEGHTIMHLSYWIDERNLLHGKYWEIIANTIKSFDLTEDDGELILKIKDNLFGDSLFSYIQALMRIVDTTLLRREKTKSSFEKDLNKCVVEHISKEHLFLTWYDPLKDPKQNYMVDYRINGNIPPIFIFGLNSEIKTLRSAVTLHQFKLWNVKNFSIGIFEERNEINQKSANKFSDICDKTYSNFYSNEDDFIVYLEKILPLEKYFIPS